ncbi:response regulator transcription factor [Paenibacillus turpanensis]|uniref:response regulator transcription factor n=1 Tax=Paenibacillus turpanensis TaxID=2689078 RepID=UPI0014080441|nr:response regulator transcription factor [Paenibacillus turpanensis]
MQTLLIVEDDETLAFGLQFSLQREGWSTVLAPTLAEARAILQTTAPDLILLDNQLPDGSGFDFCKEVRKSSHIPILFLTASDEEVHIVFGLEIGADDYITKPFRLQELISRIRAALRRAQLSPPQKEAAADQASFLAAEADRIRSGELTLSMLEQKVWLADEPLVLSPSEFKLLAYFMRHPLQVMTREILLERLWDSHGEFVDDNTLSVLIRRLREKIESDPSSPALIVTVRGSGYKWNERCERL